MKRTMLAEVFLPFVLCVSAAACQPVVAPSPHEAEAGSVTIQDTYYVRFQTDGEAYHAVPVEGDDGLRSTSGAYLFLGPVYVRRKGEDIWPCHRRGYQIPRGARIMVSSSRAPVMIATTEIGCG